MSKAGKTLLWCLALFFIVGVLGAIFGKNGSDGSGSSAAPASSVAPIATTTVAMPSAADFQNLGMQLQWNSESYADKLYECQIFRNDPESALIAFKVGWDAAHNSELEPIAATKFFDSHCPQ